CHVGVPASRLLYVSSRLSCVILSWRLGDGVWPLLGTAEGGSGVTSYFSGGPRRWSFFSQVSRNRRKRRYLSALSMVAVSARALLVVNHASPAQAACATPIACENQLPGTPQSVWDVGPGEGTTIQGFADPFSVNVGGSINFKIKSPASSYAIDIYRMGYYSGDGARLVDSITPNIAASQNQPPCNTSTSTGLVDCGNWSVSATWNVPAD